MTARGRGGVKRWDLPRHAALALIMTSWVSRSSAGVSQSVVQQICLAPAAEQNRLSQQVARMGHLFRGTNNLVNDSLFRKQSPLWPLLHGHRPSIESRSSLGGSWIKFTRHKQRRAHEQRQVRRKGCNMKKSVAAMCVALGVVASVLRGTRHVCRARRDHVRRDWACPNPNPKLLSVWGTASGAVLSAP